MKFFPILTLFGAASVLVGQTPPPSPATAPPTPQVHLAVENPAVPPPEVPPDRVVIQVGDIKITAAQFNALIDNMQPQQRAAARGNGRKQLAENIAKTLTLAQEAQQRKIDQTPEFKSQEMFQHLALMANVLAGQVGKDSQISEADVRQYYEAHKGEFETVHARHILIRFQGSTVPVRAGQKDLTTDEALAKAQEIRKKIQDGADFATLAKAESDDTGSGANGGELPPFRHGQMVPSFETAAYALKPGELSEPVKSQFGYHIILVISHDTKPFEEVRADLENRMKPEQNSKAINKFIADLQKARPPVFDPEFFPPPAPPVPISSAPVPIPPRGPIPPATVAPNTPTDAYEKFDPAGAKVTFAMASPLPTPGVVVEKFAIGNTNIDLADNKLELDGGHLVVDTKNFGKIRVAPATNSGANPGVTLWVTPAQKRDLIKLIGDSPR